MTAAPTVTAADLVPLQERLRYLRMFRLLACAAVLASWALLREDRHVGFLELALGTFTFLAIALAIEGLWRLRRRRGRHTQTILLLLDGLYLASVAYLMGGVGSPLRTLIAVHLVTVSLLASFRTGTKLALWHSLLLFVTFYMEEAGLLDTFGGATVEIGNAEFRLLVVWTGLFWLASLTTAAFAAVNERELRRQRYDLQALARLAYRLEEQASAAGVGAALVDAVTEDLGFERTVLLGRHDGELLVLAAHGVESTGSVTSPAEESVLRDAIDGRKTLLLGAHEATSDATVSQLLPKPGNLVLVPLHAKGRAVGLLIAEHAMRRGSRIERWTVSMLERFASQGAPALGGAWLLERLEHAAATDRLTGLANRAAFEDWLRRELARAETAGEPLSLIFLDLDHFKALNDSLGHHAGDAALQRVAEVLRTHEARAPMSARYGGEEFALVLPGVDAEDAVALAEELRQDVALVSREAPMTASFGVASYPQDAVDLESLVRAADAALYASKRAGRNRTTAASVLASEAA